MRVIGRQPGSAREGVDQTLEGSLEHGTATHHARFQTLRWFLATGSLAVLDGLMAFATVLALVYVRLHVLHGTWSARLSPLDLAWGIALLWVGAMVLVGLYKQQNRSMSSGSFARIVAADGVLICATVALLITLDVAYVSGLLLAMIFITQPFVGAGIRLAPQLLPGLGQTLPADPARGNVLLTSITVIEPPRPWPGLGLRELWQFRSICFVLVRRNLKVRYRQTVVGAAWALLQPTLLMVLFTVFFGILGRIPSGNLPYPVFFFLGLLPWYMVAKILNEGSTSVVANSALVTRIYFPRAYFPLSVALASLVDLALEIVVLAILMVALHVSLSPTVVLAPLLIVIAWSAALGAAFWLSALNVSYRDITQLLPFLAQLWMFSSPIIYPVSIVPPSYQNLYFVNPVALVVTGFRWAVAAAPAPPTVGWALGGIAAIALLVTGYIYFRRREPTFADSI